jgi:hypothetical protein
MIKIFGELFWQVIIDRLAGPMNAHRPILLIVWSDNDEDADSRMA